MFVTSTTWITLLILCVITIQVYILKSQWYHSEECNKTRSDDVLSSNVLQTPSRSDDVLSSNVLQTPSRSNDVLTSNMLQTSELDVFSCDRCYRQLCDNSTYECTRMIGRGGFFNQLSIHDLYPHGNPYINLTLRPRDLTGWFNTDRQFWTDKIIQFQPRLAIEVGVWKGITTSFIASEMKRLLGGGVIVAVDTWLGAFEFWPVLGNTAPVSNDRSLEFVNGYPQVFYTFLSNMIYENVSDTVIPFPVPSSLASLWFRRQSLKVDLIHIDGSHEYEDVVNDLTMWWPVLSPKGCMVGDDYSIDYWPSVVNAVTRFASQVSDTHTLVVTGPKWSLEPK